MNEEELMAELYRADHRKRAAHRGVRAFEWALDRVDPMLIEHPRVARHYARLKDRASRREREHAELWRALARWRAEHQAIGA